MASILLKYKYTELALSWLLRNNRAHDSLLFTKSAAFVNHPDSTIKINSPDCGPSSSEFRIKYTAFSDKEPIIPSLSWGPLGDDVEQLLLICEDADSPLGSPIVHGIYYGISPKKTGFGHDDFEVVKEDGNGERMLRGGMKAGLNRRGTVYGAPRPLINHGKHRYVWQLVTLGRKIDEGSFGEKRPGKEMLEKEVEGKVVGWGSWEGWYENQW